MNDIKKKISPLVIAGAVAGASVLGLGGYWFAGTSAAEKEVKSFLKDNDVYDYVDYDSVSFNPITGNVTISDIAISDLPTKLARNISYELERMLGKSDEIEIQKIVLRDYKDSRSEYVLSMSIEGADLTGVLNLSGAKLFSNHAHIRKEDQVFGYDIDIEYDKEDEEVSFDISLSASSIGELGVSGEVLDFDPRNPDEAVANLFTNRRYKGDDFMADMLGKASLQEFSVTYEDYGWLQREAEVMRRDSLSFNATESEYSEVQNMTEKQREDMIEEMTDDGLPEDLAESIADAGYKLKNGEASNYELNIEPDEPERIIKTIERMSDSSKKKQARIIEDLNISVSAS